MDYSDLIKYLKVCDQNIQTLHRHLRSDNFFEEHEVLGEYYEKIGEFIDTIVEIALSLGYQDVSIKEAIEQYNLLDCRDYTRKEAFNYVYKAFNEIINIMDDLKETIPGFITGKFEEIQYYLNIEANYKITRLFKAKLD